MPTVMRHERQRRELTVGGGLLDDQAELGSRDAPEAHPHAEPGTGERALRLGARLPDRVRDLDERRARRDEQRDLAVAAAAACPPPDRCRRSGPPGSMSCGTDLVVGATSKPGLAQRRRRRHRIEGRHVGDRDLRLLGDDDRHEGKGLLDRCARAGFGAQHGAGRLVGRVLLDEVRRGCSSA